MNKRMLLLISAEIALIATAVLFLAFQDLWNTFLGVGCVALALLLVGWALSAPRRMSADVRTAGVGTGCTMVPMNPPPAPRQIMIEVASVHAGTLIGRLVHRDGDPVGSWLRPGVVLLVAFDPDAHEQLSLPDGILAVRARSVTSK